jgi:hypothetical protein
MDVTLRLEIGLDVQSQTALELIRLAPFHRPESTRLRFPRGTRYSVLRPSALVSCTGRKPG